MGKLEGKVAIVTGGARGIGEGIASVLAREGAAVVIGDIEDGLAQATAARLQSEGYKASGTRLDVTDSGSAQWCVDAATTAFGRLDILVNNAGVLGPHNRKEVTLADWDRCYEVNLKGIWIMTHAVLPIFTAQGGGKIVNIASIAGRHGASVHPHYSASKAGAINLTQSLAVELGPRNINVNAVCPGLVKTPMMDHLEGMIGGEDPARERGSLLQPFIATRMPLRREQTPEDIGMAVAFFASDEARNITGQSLNVDGGLELN